MFYVLCRSVGMVPSPGSSLNTPGQPNQSPMGMQDEQAYRDKVRQLSKYIEPLRKMIARMGNDGERKYFKCFRSYFIKGFLRCLTN